MTREEIYQFMNENPVFHQAMQVRVSVELELVEDIALKEAIVAHPSREFLRPWIAENGLAPLAVFRLPCGRATVWTMATNFEPNRYMEIRETLAAASVHLPAAARIGK